MITYLQGNLFSLFNKVDAITNTVNCVGVMGKGIALEFKRDFQIIKSIVLNVLQKS